MFARSYLGGVELPFIEVCPQLSALLMLVSACEHGIFCLSAVCYKTCDINTSCVSCLIYGSEKWPLKSECTHAYVVCDMYPCDLSEHRLKCTHHILLHQKQFFSFYNWVNLVKNRKVWRVWTLYDQWQTSMSWRYHDVLCSQLAMYCLCWWTVELVCSMQTSPPLGSLVRPSPVSTAHFLSHRG